MRQGKSSAHGRNTVSYGEVEGARPRKRYERRNGRVSSDLDTSDIAGAQAETKRALHKPRSSIHYNASALDIEGARAGTRKRGLVTRRVTNPIEPEYETIGHTQKEVRQDWAYAEPWRDPRRLRARPARALEAHIFPTSEGAKPNASAILAPSNTFHHPANVPALPNHT